ncbi:hypothetical protein E2C01_052822 [Portunus trituberculatus]|uniref:Uncharacterized protein n=1 Tax=Portunus trituberculatus TaxID=210409 RepID=A0A5B7GMR8_PORTR|nr:hypothetical protein [Portunus trituberculatus]
MNLPRHRLTKPRYCPEVGFTRPHSTQPELNLQFFVHRLPDASLTRLPDANLTRLPDANLTRLTGERNRRNTQNTRLLIIDHQYTERIH